MSGRRDITHVIRKKSPAVSNLAKIPLRALSPRKKILQAISILPITDICIRRIAAILVIVEFVLRTPGFMDEQSDEIFGKILFTRNS
jgi:hypothetical protein